MTNLIDLGFHAADHLHDRHAADQQGADDSGQPADGGQGGADPARAGRSFVTVTIDAGGAYYLSPAATPVSLSELHTRFLAFAAEPKPPVVTVRCDASVPFQKYAAVLNELMRAGLTRISLPTKPNE